MLEIEVYNLLSLMKVGYTHKKTFKKLNTDTYKHKELQTQSEWAAPFKLPKRHQASLKRERRAEKRNGPLARPFQTA